MDADEQTNPQRDEIGDNMGDDPQIAARADRRIHLRDGLVVADELAAVSV